MYLRDRIDSANAHLTEKEIRSAISSHPETEFVLDLGGLEYISSAGLRIFFNLFHEMPKRVIVRNVTPEIYSILEMTGFTTFLDVRRKPREISLEGCRMIGRGAYGRVYRIDDDTIVKIYDSPDAEEMIFNEQRKAKYAFLKGIPTAISYDMVCAGGKLGSVFEMVRAGTFHDTLLAEPEKTDDLIEQFVRVIKHVHSIEADPGDLPDARGNFLAYLDRVEPHLGADTADVFRSLLMRMPENRHLIHGDLHMKNVMFSEDGPMLIDMDTLCTGDPVFEFAGIITAYELFNEDEPGNSMRFMGLSDEKSSYIWHKILELYLPDGAAESIETNRVRAVGYLRFLYLVSVMGNGKAELKEKRIRRSAETIRSLLPGLDELSL